MRPGQKSARSHIRMGTGMAWPSIGSQMGRGNTSLRGGKGGETEILPFSTIRRWSQPKAVLATKPSRKQNFSIYQGSELREISGWKFRGIGHFGIEGAKAVCQKINSEHFGDKLAGVEGREIVDPFAGADEASWNF